MSYSDDNSFEKILTRCLSNERLTDMDKRVGSVVYDTLAPVCLELAECYAKMDILEGQTYLATATGTYLEKRAYDYGVSRNPATYAQRVAEFKKYQKDGNGDYVLDGQGNKILVDMDVPVGTRFGIISDEELIYEYIGVVNNQKIVKCDVAGSVGNDYLGSLVPLTPVSELIRATITGNYIQGDDEETDENLRQRVYDALNYASFGGNVNDYVEKVNAIDGVGETKVFPSWNSNGSVLLSVVDPQFNPITKGFADSLKELIDPDSSTGSGVGIAPIGHYVTITTPSEFTIDVGLTIELEEGISINNIQEDVERVINNYLLSVRANFKQDTDLTIYRSDIVTAVKSLIGVLDVEDVTLNNVEQNITLIDEDDIIGGSGADNWIGKQYLPKLGVVTIG